MTILVTGASGNVGSELVRSLAAKGAKVRGLTRASSTGQVLPGGVQTVGGDLNEPESLDPALDGAVGLFLLPGYGDMPGILDRARRAGVKHVVQLSGSTTRSEESTRMWRTGRGQTIRAARQLIDAWYARKVRPVPCPDHDHEEFSSHLTKSLRQMKILRDHCGIPFGLLFPSVPEGTRACRVPVITGDGGW